MVHNICAHNLKIILLFTMPMMQRIIFIIIIYSHYMVVFWITGQTLRSYCMYAHIYCHSGISRMNLRKVNALHLCFLKVSRMINPNSPCLLVMSRMNAMKVDAHLLCLLKRSMISQERSREIWSVEDPKRKWHWRGHRPKCCPLSRMYLTWEMLYFAF